ncbi:DUF3800 domain-containing protein [Rhodobacter sp. NSM]|uniref:DUF3800 domain-containing protein n=1 Tax=Rhodobacter sp. NSM TaxID=3457501 RepID=UPI003FD4F080
MLVFIDESGDPGFKLGSGSSEVFVLAMVVFDDADDAERAERLIVEAQRTYRVKPEWKFSKSADVVRDRFFQSISAAKFTCFAIVVTKNTLQATYLRESKEAFYQFFLERMLTFNRSILCDARVIIDGSGDRLFKQELVAHLRRGLPTGAIKKITFKDSTNSPLVQLADMCAGAIARSYTQKPQADRWSEMLRANGQTPDIWHWK